MPINNKLIEKNVQHNARLVTSKAMIFLFRLCFRSELLDRTDFHASKQKPMDLQEVPMILIDHGRNIYHDYP